MSNTRVETPAGGPTGGATGSGRGRRSREPEQPEASYHGAAATVGQLAKDQAGWGADRLHHLAEAGRQSAQNFEGESGWVADLIRRAAGEVDAVADSLHQRDLNRLVQTTEEFARRQPALFLGAALALGFGVMRLANAGRDRDSEGFAIREPSERLEPLPDSVGPTAGPEIGPALAPDLGSNWGQPTATTSREGR